MSVINVTLPSDGTSANVADYNDPINAILAGVNGGLDDTNISSLSGTKIIVGTLPDTAATAAAKQGWITGSTVPTSITALGNRSYQAVYASSIAGYKSPGMRSKFTRSVTAPTQCTSLNGTTQYYSRVSGSVAGMTFTDDFALSAWVKISSYAASGQMIASRNNGTSGWDFSIESSGRVQLLGRNAAAGNYRGGRSYQSIPLNKWVHVAMQIDMSTYTATTTTIYCMIDGIDVPTETMQGGTNPTSLIQAGNLEVGSWSGGLLPFSGKIAQVAIYNAKVTQATILASMNQTLTGSETSLISAYSFNNTINDLNTTNANNLTANGSAVATNADSPFSVNSLGTATGTTDYAITTLISADGLTETLQVPEANTIPTSGGVSAVAYSTQKAPYGFPTKAAERLVSLVCVSQSGIGTSSTQVNGLRITFNAVAKEYRIKAFARDVISAGGAAYVHWQLWSGTVGSGTLINETQPLATAASVSVPTFVEHTLVVTTPGSLTINVGLYGSSNTVGTEKSTTYPAYLSIEPVEM